MVLGLAFEIWQLLDGFADDAESVLDLVFANDQGRCETDDVLVRWLGLLRVRYDAWNIIFLI